MNEDRILEMFFEKARWQYAIEKGLFKDMNKAVMYQLTTPKARLAMYQRIKSGNYKIMPPHTAKIPKDNGDFRTVYVNEAVDRILLSIANDLLFELMPEMVHPRCTSYQKGIGCGRVVQEVSRIIYSAEGKVIGWKGDFSKYFDSVPIRFIDWAFDKVEEKFGKSALIDVIRDYYHTDIYFDEDNNLCEKYQSLKQGCSVAAWLADVILYHLDDKLSKLNGYYVRYSDDTLFVGEDYEKAMDIMKSELEMMQMTLNPKKVEYLDANHWFKFLGYSIKGHNISLSSTRIKTFQKEIEKRTIKKRDAIFDDSQYLTNKFFSLGFVGGAPTMIEYHRNYLSIRKLRSWITSEWGREIVKRLTGESKNSIYYYDTKQYLDERQAEPLIYTFFLSTDYLTVRFHYNVKVDED